MAPIPVSGATPDASAPRTASPERIAEVAGSVAAIVRQEGLHETSVEGNTVQLARIGTARGWAWWDPLAAVQRGTLTITTRDGEIVIEPRLELDGLQRWPASWSFLLPLPLLLLTDSAREAIPYYAVGYAALAALRPIVARLLLPRALRRFLLPGPAAEDPH